MKNQKTLIQFIKFAIIGVTNTAVDWLVFFALTSWVVFFSVQANEVWAKAIAFLVAVINSFIWNSIWTFRQEFRQKIKKDQKAVTGSIMFTQFLIVSLVGLGVNSLIFYLVRNYSASYFQSVTYSQIVSLIFASAGATFWNFLANKFWTYRVVEKGGKVDSKTE